MPPKPLIALATVALLAAAAMQRSGAAGAAPAGGASPYATPQAIDREGLCVTSGEVRAVPGARLAIDAAKVRAVVIDDTPQAAELRFTYLGPTADTAPLASGDVRRQLGLKLLAADGCNLVYVMWRLAPESKIVVSTKINPGQHSSAECGNRGYTNLKPLGKPHLPAVTPGSRHSLRAELTGGNLRAWADGALVWAGSLGPAAAELHGTVGLRTDNVRLDFQYLVGGGPPAPLSHLPDRQRRKCEPAPGGD
jgi:hypothetical protein